MVSGSSKKGGIAAGILAGAFVIGGAGISIYHNKLCDNMVHDAKEAYVMEKTIEDYADDYCEEQKFSSTVRECTYTVSQPERCDCTLTYLIEKMKPDGERNGCFERAFKVKYDPIIEDIEKAEHKGDKKPESCPGDKKVRKGGGKPKSSWQQSKDWLRRKLR
ncbi:hypothetical protein ACFL96_07425 [Thermoproteota archaeon]